jgi:hypothetical protein
MKEFRARTGPYHTRLHYTVDEIDDYCLEALAKSKYLPQTPSPIRIDRFVEKHFECTTGYENLDAGIMGYTLFDKNGKPLQVRISEKLEDGTRAAERRARTTWAHEGGHCLLHPKLFMDMPGQPTFDQSEQNSNIKDGRILCRDTDVRPANRRYDGRWWEWQANRCIGGFLLPKPLVRKAIADLLVEAFVTSRASLPPAKVAAAIEIVAETFDVNPVVARIRLEEMFPPQNGQIEF